MLLTIPLKYVSLSVHLVHSKFWEREVITGCEVFREY